jgi:hypothetical protein
MIAHWNGLPTMNGIISPYGQMANMTSSKEEPPSPELKKLAGGFYGSMGQMALKFYLIMQAIRLREKAVKSDS